MRIYIRVYIYIYEYYIRNRCIERVYDARELYISRKIFSVEPEKPLFVSSEKSKNLDYSVIFHFKVISS